MEGGGTSFSCHAILKKEANVMATSINLSTSKKQKRMKINLLPYYVQNRAITQKSLLAAVAFSPRRFRSWQSSRNN